MRKPFLVLALALLAPLAGVRGEDVSTAKEEKKAATGKQTLAVFRLSSEITESPPEDDFGLGGVTPVSLKDLVSRIKKAGDDPKIKAMVVLADNASLGLGQTEELRQALAEARAAGKEVYSHSDSMSMGRYLLLCGASRLSVTPTADLWIYGLHGESLYLRGLLDKIGVRPDFLTCGAYKSAAETFMRSSPSPESDAMHNWLFDGLYEASIKRIAEGRKVDAAKVRGWIDAGPYTAEKAKQAGLVDAIEHRQDFTEILKTKYGKDVVFDRKYGDKKHASFDLSSPFGALKLWTDLLGDMNKKKSSKPAVGIVYVDGGIALGASQRTAFGRSGGAMSSDIRKALDDAAADDSIKAVVLRVNSPGGSAVASEIILDATKRVKAKKPFVVSMGDVAGSGGYYVACGADTIFADEATITGSIGVVAGKLVTTAMWKNIGITFKSYNRGANAGMLSSEDVFSPKERERMQSWMDEIYGVFKKHVTTIRGDRLKKPIDELAGGRVYTGRQALELGLVDKIGTLQDAVHHVAAQAKLTNYEVRVVPEPKNILEQVLEDLSGDKDKSDGIGLSTDRPASLVELAMPHLQHLDPNRVRAIRAALQQLQLVQQEGVVLLMPEVLSLR